MGTKMKKEVWKDIIETKGRYAISNHGRLKHNITKRIVIVKGDDRGYSRYGVSINGERKSLYIGNLVAKYFVDKDAKYIIYKDGDNTNNYYENIEVKAKIRCLNDDKEDIVWKEIEDHRGYYISNYGDVKNHNNTFLSRSGNKVYIHDYKTDKNSSLSVPILVAKYFIEGDYKAYHKIQFKDGNENNLYYKNLSIDIINKNDCEWRQILDSHYIISEYGDVVNTESNSIIEVVVHNELPMVSIYAKKKRKRSTLSVAKLVATAFIPNENDYCFVKHVDYNKKHNHYSNLYWSKCSFAI